MSRLYGSQRHRRARALLLASFAFATGLSLANAARAQCAT